MKSRTCILKKTAAVKQNIVNNPTEIIYGNYYNQGNTGKREIPNFLVSI